jgi:hypothetical protein
LYFGHSFSDFLRQHQPLPDDANLSKEVIRQYDEVIQYFLAHPAPECVPLFLNSFGKGDGFGVYVMVEEVIRQFPTEQVVPHLIEALANPLPGVRYWSAQLAANFSNSELIEPLTRLLQNQDEDIPFAAVTALEQIGGESVAKTWRRGKADD